MNLIRRRLGLRAISFAAFITIPAMASGQELLHAFVGDSSQWDSAMVEFDTVGDVNGDGIADFIYGCSGGWRMHRVRSGSDWSTIARYRSTLTSVYDDNHGATVSGIGLWDDDDVPDYAVGAPTAFSQQFCEGCVRVFSGATHMMIQEISEHIYNDLMGRKVVGLGDLDGDGYTELAATGIGKPYVRIYGGPDGHLVREHSMVWAGPRVARYGDSDGDGGADYLIGDYCSGPPPFSGRVLLCSGRTGEILMIFPGQRQGEEAGVSVCAAGDWNGDGVADIAVGAPGSEATYGGSLSGVYVFSGKDASVLRFFDGADYAKATSGFGYSVASGRDLNGDGFPDLVVGAPAQTFGSTHYRQGAVYVISGRTGAVLWQLRGTYDDDDHNLGMLVYMIDDHDHDGFDEWVVSDPRFTNPIQNGGGRIAIYRGSPGDQAHLCPTTPNSAGHGVHLFAEGPISLRNNSLSFTVDGGPGPVTGFLVYGTPEPPVPFGDGTLCVQCPCHTAGFLTLDGGGAGFLPVDLWSPPFSSGLGAIAAGDTVAFQFLYPDPAAATRNASDSIVIRFVP